MSIGILAFYIWRNYCLSLHGASHAHMFFELAVLAKAQGRAAVVQIGSKCRLARINGVDKLAYRLLDCRTKGILEFIRG